MANHIFQIKARIIKNINLTTNYYKLTLSCLSLAKAAQPGQFVMLRLSDDYQPLLRRPFSIHSVSNQPAKHSNHIDILYKVIGKGTELLSKKKPGEYLDVLGPLGNGFDYRKSIATGHKPPILVGGGMGVAPLLFLAQTLAKCTKQNAGSKPLVLIGANTKKEILAQKEFAKLGLSVKISTDDGSAGFKGKATSLLKHLLSTINYKPSTIYACGPKPMLKQTSLICRQHNLALWVSLDEYMACGLGVCLGCIVKTKAGYQTVCKDGPVFDAKTVVW